MVYYTDSMSKKRLKKGKIVVNKTISCDGSADAGSEIHDLVSVDGTLAAGVKKACAEKSEDIVKIITDIQSEEDLESGVKPSPVTRLMLIQSPPSSRTSKKSFPMSRWPTTLNAPEAVHWRSA